MAQFQVGAYEVRPVTTTPTEVAQLLDARAASGLSKADIAEIFMDLNVHSVSFHGCKLDGALQDALSECIAKSMTLTEISFRGSSSSGSFDILGICSNALVENLSVQKLDLGECGIDAQRARQIGENIVPWNRTVVDWDFSGNQDLGDEGAMALVTALAAATSSIQRLSLRATGLTDVDKIAKRLEELTCLFQIDLSENAGKLSSAAAQSLQSVLMNNFVLLHPNAKPTLVPLVPAAAEPAPAQPATSADGAPAPAAESGTKEGSAEKKTTPARQRGSSVKQPQQQPRLHRSDSKVGRGESAGGTSTASPARKEQDKSQSNNGAASSSPPPKANENSNAAASGEQPTKKSDQPAGTNGGDSKQSAATSGGDGKASAGGKTQSGGNKPADQPARGRSPSARPASSPARTTTRAASAQPAAAQRDILDGVEEWKKIRNQYNQFIRAASPAGTTASTTASKAPQKFKFCLGKRIEDRPIPSPAFKAGPTRSRERMPTPLEIRKLAPWNKTNGETSVGQVCRVELEERTGVTKEPVVVTFVDGGRQTYIEDDPRDLGHLARKIQNGLVKPSGTLYRSNTPRDMRFGVDHTDKSFVHHYAQAPAPGTYVVESEWDKRARLLRERARSMSGTGKPLFGSSCAPRAAFLQTKKDLERPGPGEYEIP